MPWRAGAAEAADPEAAGWLLICAAGGSYYLNPETGERRDAPDEDTGEHAALCHAACSRRKS